MGGFLAELAPVDEFFSKNKDDCFVGALCDFRRDILDLSSNSEDCEDADVSNRPTIRQQKALRTSISLALADGRAEFDWQAYGSSITGAGLVSLRLMGGSGSAPRLELLLMDAPPLHWGHPQLEFRRHGPVCLPAAGAADLRMGRSSNSRPVVRFTSRNNESCSEFQQSNATVNTAAHVAKGGRWKTATYLALAALASPAARAPRSVASWGTSARASRVRRCRARLHGYCY